MVELSHVSLSYPRSEECLKDVNMKVKSGECVLITGESGSGKSSVINVINGIAVNYHGCKLSGEVKVGGKEAGELSLYQLSMLVSSVFQNPKTHFFNVNTTLELVFYLENIGLKREEMEKRLSELLEVFDIGHLLNRDIFRLSGGEKQILSIAAAYISGNRIIVLDEPSSNLDRETTLLIKNMLKRLKEKGITLLIAEHRIFYLSELADRVIVMKEGRIGEEYEGKRFFGFTKEELKRKGIRNPEYEALTAHPPENEGSIRVERLQYGFSGGNRGILIKDLSLNTGKIYGVIGKNGVGKSTFIKNFIGVMKGGKEEIFRDGVKISRRKRLKESSLVMQDVNSQLFSENVETEVVLGLKEAESEKRDIVLEKLGLLSLKDRHPMSLSGGEKQRVAVASAILSDSKIICFDEPTSGMDLKNMLKISALIKSTLSKEKIIFIISHDTEFLNLTADGLIDMGGYSF